MTLAQHTDYRIRYQQQLENARDHILPFVEKHLAVNPELRIMDIGCGEGGVLIPFLEKGCSAVGVELDELKSGYAKQLLASRIEAGKVEIVNQNIYEEAALERFRGQFDLIILKDVIEHIPNQEKFIPYLKQFLKPGGFVFFGFPPWYMPHGGHQQVCRSKFLSMLPWFHLLPNPVYTGILRLSNEYPAVIRELLENKSTGISIERFEKIALKSGYEIRERILFLINPIYQQKFGLKPRKQWGLIAAIPWVRDFFSTCAYYIIQSGRA